VEKDSSKGYCMLLVVRRTLQSLAHLILKEYPSSGWSRIGNSFESNWILHHIGTVVVTQKKKGWDISREWVRKVRSIHEVCVCVRVFIINEILE